MRVCGCTFEARRRNVAFASLSVLGGVALCCITLPLASPGLPLRSACHTLTSQAYTLDSFRYITPSSFKYILPSPVAAASSQSYTLRHDSYLSAASSCFPIIYIDPLHPCP